MKIAADLCTLVRVALAPLFAWSLSSGASDRGLLPLLIYAVAALSDFADGRLARAAGAGTRLGRFFDHGADALFLFPALAVLAAGGRLPTLLPIAAVTAFALYCIDGVRRGGSLRAIDLLPNPSGAAAGVLNYAIAGVTTGAVVLGSSGLDAFLYGAALAVAAVNTAAAVERLQRLAIPAHAVHRRAAPPP